MSKAFVTLISPISRLWTRFNRFLVDQNDQRVAAWGSALQYKRRYTNPDAAKKYRAQP